MAGAICWRDRRRARPTRTASQLLARSLAASLEARANASAHMCASTCAACSRRSPRSVYVHKIGACRAARGPRRRENTPFCSPPAELVVVFLTSSCALFFCAAMLSVYKLVVGRPLRCACALLARRSRPDPPPSLRGLSAGGGVWPVASRNRRTDVDRDAREGIKQQANVVLQTNVLQSNEGGGGALCALFVP